MAPCPPPTLLLPLLPPFPALTLLQTASTSPTPLLPPGQTVSSTVPPSATTPLLPLPVPPDAAAILATLTTKWALPLTLPSKTLPTLARKPPADSALRLSNAAEMSSAMAMQSSRMSSPSPTRRAVRSPSLNEVCFLVLLPLSHSLSHTHTYIQLQIILSF